MGAGQSPSVEYGVRITYDDGYVEYERYSSRAAAELRERSYNSRRPENTGTAEVVSRPIGVWGPVNTPSTV